MADNPYESSHVSDLAPLRSSPWSASGTLVVLAMLIISSILVAVAVVGIGVGLLFPGNEPEVQPPRSAPTTHPQQFSP